ncbi:MAG TPA: ABC transporter permease [Clostridia bacterium]|nr:ABC transporter permease [Clostridia bacterium]
MSIAVWSGALEQGLLWAAMVLGVYLTFRVLDFPDLTIDGCFTLGAAVVTRFILEGFNPLLGMTMAMICGAAAGLVTGFLHTRLRIAPLLAGILTMIALYSINLRVMGAANLSLLRMNTAITWIMDLGFSKANSAIILGTVATALVVTLLYLFLNTEMGMAIRATGDNEQMIRSLGVNTDSMKMIGLSLGNAMVALSGGMVAQYQGFADIGMGIGMIIMGLAAVIIGEALVGTKNLLRALVAVVVGSFVYRLVISVVLQLGLPTTDLKLFTAAIVVLALAFPIVRENLKIKQIGGGKNGVRNATR